jgi:hypothetical protein
MTYYNSQLKLDIALEGLVRDSSVPSGNAWYSLDEQEKVSLLLVYEGISDHNGNAMPHYHFSGVTNLPALSDGQHTVTAFGELNFGTYSFDNNITAAFAVYAHSTPAPSPFSSPESSPTNGNSSPTPTNTPSISSSSSSIPTATAPEFPAWIILPLVIAATLLTVITVRKKSK